MRLLKILLVLFVFMALALVGYAYLGDLRAPQSEQRIPVTLGDG